jgi:hypothetical protein
MSKKDRHTRFLLVIALASKQSLHFVVSEGNAPYVAWFMLCQGEWRLTFTVAEIKSSEMEFVGVDPLCRLYVARSSQQFAAVRITPLA